MHVAPGTVVVFADIACPWSHVAVHRLHEARARSSLEERVVFDIRAFPLELINRRPTPKRTLDAEVPVAGALAPEAGWQMWRRPDYQYPVTTLPALEAVQAAKHQSLKASETLDRGLRRALFRESRTISMLHEILEVASTCTGLDIERLEADLAHGRARHGVMEDLAIARTDAVQGSPHVFLPDGTSEMNPGTTIKWLGEEGRGFPVVVEDHPERYEEIVQVAAK